MSNAKCYYPNGAESSGDIPCGNGDGVACCPQGWTCEANGLCHLATPFYYGRYTCTDQSWKAKGCPNICTHGNTAAGAEAVIECSSGSYCCDANRPDALPDGSIDSTKDCCHTSNDRFPLAQLPLAPGGTEDSDNSAAASSSTSSASPSTAQASSSSTSHLSATPSSTTSPVTSQSITSRANTKTSNNPQPSTQIITSVITQNAGGSSTLITTTSNAALPASNTPSPTASSSGSKNLGSIIGPAVAVPIAVLLLAALAFFLFRRRRRQDRNRASSPPPMRDNLQPMYGADGKDLVDSPYTGKSELEGSPNPNIAAVRPPGKSNDYNAPNDVGTAGTEASKSELAASNSTAGRSPKSRLSELQGSPSIGETMEEGAHPAELQGNDTQADGYKPYRPPGLGLSS